MVMNFDCFRRMANLSVHCGPAEPVRTTEPDRAPGSASMTIRSISVALSKLFFSEIESCSPYVPACMLMVLPGPAESIAACIVLKQGEWPAQVGLVRLT